MFLPTLYTILIETKNTSKDQIILKSAINIYNILKFLKEFSKTIEYKKSYKKVLKALLKVCYVVLL